MIVWTLDGVEQQSSLIKRIFESMPEVDGEVITVDVENYHVILRLHPMDKMDMMK